MVEAQTVPAKYIFMDVVGFTHERSVEAQSDIVHALNQIVDTSIAEHEVLKEKIIFLPTGDGICIVLLNVETPYDIHLLIALSIIKGVHEYCQNVQNTMREFQIRIGLNANTDNLVTDINGNQNIAGAGINMASRVMSMADGNQILVGEPVFNTLRYREKYMKSFEPFQATVKHGLQIPIYQFIENGHLGLNTAVPQIFKNPEKIEPKLSEVAAYYFAHAIKNRAFFLAKKGTIKEFTATILLWLLARDSVMEAHATETDVLNYETYRGDGAGLEERYDYYRKIDYHLMYRLAQFIHSIYLRKYDQYFIDEALFTCRFINSDGEEKLRSEWPKIWDSFGLQSPSNKSFEPTAK